MKTINIFWFSLITLSFFSCQTKEEASNELPNIIYILADDLGYGELGSYGQSKIETPNLDALAASGMRFTRHYSGSPVCAPSRAVLMTGLHTGHAPVRGNDEWASRGKVWDYRAMFRDSTLEGQRPLPEGMPTLGSLLQQAGYSTGIVGKWGLGAPNTHSIPNKMGFDFFFGYNCQRQAHTFYPLHLYKNDKRVFLQNDTVPPNTKLAEGVDPYDESSFADYTLTDYSPDLMFEEIQGFVDQNKDQPFFLYWATPIPHVPLQAPQKWVDYYHEKFGEEEPYLGDRGYFPTRYPRATYAAMISYLDEQIGELIRQLKASGQYENTLIIFSSDNGPTYAGGADTEWFDSAKPFGTVYGKAKGFVYEGGIRVPMIASWPGRIGEGTTSNHVSAFWDVLPTLCDVAGVQPPENIDGISFLPELLGEEQPEHDYLYWEFPAYTGQRALRMGQWKLVQKGLLKEAAPFELYNLAVDSLEQDNVADQHPQIIEQMQTILDTLRTEPAIERFKMEYLGDKKAKQ
jgi:arylsulfatase A-like enzyme